MLPGHVWTPTGRNIMSDRHPQKKVADRFLSCGRLGRYHACDVPVDCIRRYQTRSPPPYIRTDFWLKMTPKNFRLRRAEKDPKFFSPAAG